VWKSVEECGRVWKGVEEYWVFLVVFISLPSTNLIAHNYGKSGREWKRVEESGSGRGRGREGERESGRGRGRGRGGGEGEGEGEGEERGRGERERREGEERKREDRKESLTVSSRIESFFAISISIFAGVSFAYFGYKLYSRMRHIPVISRSKLAISKKVKERSERRARRRG
jgi:hypothetical protein